MIEPDHTQSTEISGLMRDAVRRMHESADDTGAAVWVKETAKKYMEHLLAKYVAKTPALDTKGKLRSMKEREYEAMVMPDYHSEFEIISNGLKEANKLLKRWEVNEKAFEGNRSMLSFSKRIRGEEF